MHSTCANDTGLLAINVVVHTSSSSQSILTKTTAVKSPSSVSFYADNYKHRQLVQAWLNAHVYAL